jgi:pimeloyl-ACP methyl ester carboxylesterase
MGTTTAPAGVVELLTGRPALVIWGMRDTAFPPRMLARWRSALPAARILDIAEAGPWPHEESPEPAIAELRRFLTASPAHG